MALKDLFKQHYETGENAVEKSLMTHYYKNNFKQAKAAVIEVSDSLGFSVKFEDDDRLELMLVRRDAELIVSMVKITPIETAIDFTANTEQLITLGKGKKLIASMYEGLNSKLNFKGQALKR